MTRHKPSKRPLYAAIASALAVATGFGATATAEESISASAAENGNLWFVELSGNPTADGNSLAAVRNEKAEFRKAAAQAGVQYTERRSYDVLFNGFSIAVDPANRNKVAALPGVKAMYPVEVVQAPNPTVERSISPDLVAAITATGAKIAQDSRGLTGKGIKVGIVDSGIDIDHPAFGGSGVNGTTTFPTARVAYGYDFVGDAYNSVGTGTAPVPVPDPNPDDCGGHGTHVAGIVGADGAGIKGVAPEVTLGAYRVFGCSGSSSADVIVSALERAYADGMHVINQSLGAARQWPQYPTAQASSRLVNKGVVVVASIGNSGPGGTQPDGLYAGGAPGVGDKVIGVASFDNAQRSFTAGSTPYGFIPATASPLPPTSGSLPLGRTWNGAAPNPATSTTAAPVDDGCAVLPAGSLAGQAVLIRRGTCGFHVKALNAQNAGAAAVILYNNQAGTISPTVAGTPAITIPVVAVTASQGVALHNLISGGSATLTWSADYVSYPFGTGGLISGFSSFGLTAELGMKPNIGAPGGSILSTYPLEAGGSAVLSGTSMSSPHVAGAVALILQAKPKASSNSMMTRLQNSADPRVLSTAPDSGILDHSYRQGAGMIDILGTLDATTVVEPSQIAVGESEFGPKTFTIRVKNEASSSVTYDLSHVATAANAPNNRATLGVTPPASYAPGTTLSAPAAVTFSAPSVTVGPGASATFDVTIDANSGLPERSLYGGFVVLTPQGGGAVYRVPFAGLKGDYQSTQVLSTGASGFPVLGRLNPAGTSYGLLRVPSTFTMVGNDYPQFLLHFDHHARRVRIEAFEAASLRSWHRIADDQYIPRNSTPNGFFAFGWDGTTFAGNGRNLNQWRTVPNGTYVVKVSVLKALGDESNPAHWETWTSPEVTIARP